MKPWKRDRETKGRKVDRTQSGPTLASAGREGGSRDKC